MLTNQICLENNNIKIKNLIKQIVRAELNDYISLLFHNLERQDPKLKKLISPYLYFQEKRLNMEIKKVTKYIHDPIALKESFKSIGAKYLKSSMNLDTLNSLCSLFLESLEIYLLFQKKKFIKQELLELYQVAIGAILDGAKEEYSLWHKKHEDTFTCVNRMKIEVIIQRTLALSYYEENIVTQRLLQKNVYFQKAVDKIGTKKTKELIASAIHIVQKKYKLGVD